jgi:peptidoglycan/LPS O-acetylase OafA/YrhL
VFQDGAQKPVGRFYRPELDGLRFLAFFLVFLSHTIPLNHHSPHWLIAARSGCAFGVPVFFVLSAYLISELLVREKEATKSVNIKKFYTRRALRIWPLYLLTVLAAYSLSKLNLVLNQFPGDRPMTLAALFSYLLLAGNWYTVMRGFLPLGIGTLWSISVEEQFYLIWPSIIKYGDKKVLLGACATGWISSQMAVLALCYFGVQISPELWTNSLTHLQYFAIGAAMSAISGGKVPAWSATTRILMILSGIITFFLANEIFNAYMYEEKASISKTYPGYLIAGLGAYLITSGALGWRWPSQLKMLPYLGKISYGLYVYHLPVVIIATGIAQKIMNKHTSIFVTCVALPTTILISTFSYRYIETPFLRLKEGFTVVKSRGI